MAHRPRPPRPPPWRTRTRRIDDIERELEAPERGGAVGQRPRRAAGDDRASEDGTAAVKRWRALTSKWKASWRRPRSASCAGDQRARAKPRPGEARRSTQRAASRPRTPSSPSAAGRRRR
ncbi:MAG: hypothetical protein MZV70_53545 [Desulfobacterales bacterium]|nr:hypothetical protein [Desulfobacterales bacterium]